MDEVLDLKQIFIDTMKTGLVTYKIAEQFPKEKDVKVIGIHPFAYLYESKTANVLPSIAISTTGRAPDEQTLGYEDGETELTEADVDVQIALAGDLARSRITPLSELQALKAFINGEGGTIQAPTRIYQIDTVVTFEVWTENMDAKDKLFNIVYGTLFRSLIDLARKEVENITLAGDEDSAFNYDFGRVLYGARININTNRPFKQYEVDTGVEIITEIEPKLEADTL